MKYRYKFLREGFRSNSGNLVWDTKWKHEDELIMCKKGLHCSKTKYQAFSYVQGEILAKVEVKGKSIKSEDKEVWSNMRIVRAWKWQKKDSVSLAIYSAQLVLKNFEKIENFSSNFSGFLKNVSNHLETCKIHYNDCW